MSFRISFFFCSLRLGFGNLVEGWTGDVAHLMERRESYPFVWKFANVVSNTARAVTAAD